jgi:Pyruvate/2-oxoacid:ferredoxin oxidoreductase delta subunit
MLHSNFSLFYFSGTGNALTVSKWIQSLAIKNDVKCDIYNISNSPDDKKIYASDSTLGFIYPTHGFNAVPAMLKFLIKLPSTRNKKYFLMNTRAGGKFLKYNTPGLSGIALLLPILILFLKGYKLSGATSVDMPSNWISVHPGYSRKWIDFIIKNCNQKVDIFFSKLMRGKRPTRRIFADLPIDLLLIPISIGYYFIGRFIIAKTFITNSECNNCNLCVNNCPVNAIKIVSGKPYWSYRCESCMKCINYCPKKSIHTSHLIFAAAIIIFNLPLTIYISNLIPSLHFIDNLFVNFVFESILSLFIIFLFYFISHYIIKFYFFDKLFTYTSLTHYWKKYHAPNITHKDFK